MLRSFVLICTLGVALGYAGDASTGLLNNQYASVKIMTSCLGEEPMARYFAEMKAAYETCKSDETDYNNLLDIDSYIESQRYNLRQQQRFPAFYQSYWQQQQYPQQQQFQPQQQAYNRQFNQQYNPQYNQQYQQYQQQPNQFQQGPQPFGQPFHSINKRQAEEESSLPAAVQEEFAVVEQKVKSRISNITCVMRQMNFLDAENQPNWSYTKNTIQELPIGDELKNDLLESHDFCREFSMCLPVHKMKDPLTRELGYPMAFHKCMQEKKLRICQQHDFRRLSQMLAIPGQEIPDFRFNTASDFLMEEDSENEQYAIQRMMSLFDGGIFDF